jgi:D-threo-aldose 1-dehydrogenase
MKTRYLGSTGLALSELSFGGGAIGGLYRAVDRDRAMQTLDAAWESGIRYFDTAPFYGFGLSERRVGDFLRSKPPDTFVLSTKVGKLLSPVAHDKVPDHGFVDPLPFTVGFDYSYDAVMRSYEASIARLGLNRIDILYVHDLEPGGFAEEEYEDHLRTFLNGGVRALEELKESGAIRAWGLGVNEVAPCVDILQRHSLDCILLAGRYTLLDRRGETALLSLCQNHSTSLVIGGVFNSGILATGPRPDAYYNYQPAPDDIMKRVARMEDVVTGHGLTLAGAALRFPLGSPLVASVLIGTANANSVDRNVALLDVDVPKTVFDQLEVHALR